MQAVQWLQQAHPNNVCTQWGCLLNPTRLPTINLLVVMWSLTIISHSEHVKWSCYFLLAFIHFKADGLCSVVVMGVNVQMSNTLIRGSTPMILVIVLKYVL